MSERPCSGSSSEAVLTAEQAAIEMYRFAALMLGSEAEALELVESTVAAVDIDPCADPSRAEGIVRVRVVQGALEIMHRQDPASFASVPEPDPCSPCLDDDASAPVSKEEIAAVLSEAGRGRIREWLGQLSLAERAVFLQRAVLGSSNAETASAINPFARPAIWTAEAVARLFRQALCSLATAMVHATPASQG